MKITEELAVEPCDKNPTVNYNKRNKEQDNTRNSREAVWNHQ
jgi:hypothetical protein